MQLFDISYFLCVKWIWVVNECTQHCKYLWNIHIQWFSSVNLNNLLPFNLYVLQWRWLEHYLKKITCPISSFMLFFMQVYYCLKHQTLICGYAFSFLRWSFVQSAEKSLRQKWASVQNLHLPISVTI